MNLYQLRYFLELAEKRQYTKAARQLNITQPSLSYAISQLENELGVNYLKRMDARSASPIVGEISPDVLLNPLRSSIKGSPT